MGMGMPWMTLQSGLLPCAESSKGLPIPLALSFISCWTIQCLWIPYYTLAASTTLITLFSEMLKISSFKKIL
jgi:hypothetical protein